MKWCSFFILLLVTLCVVGLGSCTEESRMIDAISEREPGFDADAGYAIYLQQHGESANRLRTAAAEATTLRVYIKVFRYQKDVEEYIPLTESDTQAVREILAEVQEPPPYDFSLWLAEEYDSYFVQAAPPPYIVQLEFLSSKGGGVLPLHDGITAEMGDMAKSEEYRTMRPRPTYTLPSASLARWNALPFLNNARARVDELYKNN